MEQCVLIVMVDNRWIMCVRAATEPQMFAEQRICRFKYRLSYRSSCVIWNVRNRWIIDLFADLRVNEHNRLIVVIRCCCLVIRTCKMNVFWIYLQLHRRLVKLYNLLIHLLHQLTEHFVLIYQLLPRLLLLLGNLPFVCLLKFTLCCFDSLLDVFSFPLNFLEFSDE